MTSDIEIVVSENAPQEVAERLVEAARRGGNIALTGGSSAGHAYELVPALETDWTGVELWWGDERCVPPDDEQSNYGLAKATLLDHISSGAVHRMRGELGCEAGADAYDQELDGFERFGLVFLGLGPDGHIASLYPDQPTLDETARRAVGAEAKFQPFIDRITLTLPVLRAADEVLFLVTGENKAEAAKRAFVDEPSRATPGSLVRADGGRTIAVLDAAAAALL